MRQKRFYIFASVFIVTFLVAAHHVSADFGEDIDSGKAKPKLTKESKSKPELENRRLKESREKPEREKQERVEPEYKKWWQWEREQQEELNTE